MYVSLLMLERILIRTGKTFRLWTITSCSACGGEFCRMFSGEFFDHLESCPFRRVDDDDF